MRVPPPAHYDLLLSCHGCCCCPSVGIAICEGVEQPHDEQETGNTAEDNADNGARLWPGQVVVGWYYALLYDGLLPPGDGLCPRRKLLYLCCDGIVGFAYCGHGGD